MLCRYDEEDRIADEVYDAIDHRMDGRRKSRREARLKEEIAKMRAEKPTIHQQFADLKKGLATVTQGALSCLTVNCVSLCTAEKHSFLQTTKTRHSRITLLRCA